MGLSSPSGSGWEGILDPGEQVLWQGRPVPGLNLTRDSIRQAAFGLPVVFFGILWTSVTIAAQDGSLIARLFPLMGVAVLFLGLWRVCGQALWDAWVRARTVYTLTDRRVFIATDTGKRRLRSWPIDGMTLIDYDGATPGTIWFAESFNTTRPGRRRIGFERIAEARHVHDLLRRIRADRTMARP